MAKALKIEVGNWVAFNLLNNAIFFEVLLIDGFNLTVRESEEFVPQITDKSLVKQVRTTKPE